MRNYVSVTSCPRCFGVLKILLKETSPTKKYRSARHGRSSSPPVYIAVLPCFGYIRRSVLPTSLGATLTQLFCTFIPPSKMVHSSYLLNALKGSWSAVGWNMLCIPIIHSVRTVIGRTCSNMDRNCVTLALSLLDYVCSAWKKF